jgi:hypothetical protein
MTLHTKKARMDSDLDAQDGRWWKFEDYTVSGRFIVPGEGVRLLRYDPWEGYTSTEGQRRTVRPPYQSLLDLARRMKFRPNRSRYVPTPETEHMMLEWVRQWGLLGILPVRYEIITLPHVRYVRRAGVWSATIRKVVESKLPLQGALAATKRKAGRDPKYPKTRATVESSPPTQSALEWRWEDNDFRAETIERVVLEFFPDVLRQEREHRFLIPRPCSVSFWHQYAEPVELIARSAMKFSQAVEIVSRYKGPDRTQDAEKIMLNEALYFLEGFSQSIGAPPRFKLGTSHLTRSRVSPSLLASLVEMFLCDMESERRAYRCEVCQSVFISDDRRAKYCSPRHRNTMQRRRDRGLAEDES